jgi:hypothetical protein
VRVKLLIFLLMLLLKHNLHLLNLHLNPLPNPCKDYNLLKADGKVKSSFKVL